MSDPHMRCPRLAAHLHLHDDLTVSLYQKSETLWKLPKSEQASPDTENCHVMLAFDPRLPSADIGRGPCRFSSSIYPVRIPTPSRNRSSSCSAGIGTVATRHWMALPIYMFGASRGNVWLQPSQ
ncbi:hypothetical protein T310_0969 [Rasamsonia emersonii CBS 393.64]|uniref:Uncharacterized protein n=1 Tax=Rasamsonia emersonii (strain ATCC 16479 / CBS 393.64 / IMI 116815) TaxID=1408163 RepID=A0A0F4Z522_RASE3|nr:hypothetical protein T310_0969 [Rasamsonia emersonii CBS 393.64]KKA24988.1 hypothetical protein T310_0969 [Rasamsonia emersonii CBS 393.64]